MDETGTRTPIVSPYQNLKIDYTRTLGIRTWSILDESGTLYNFGSQDVNEAVETSTFDQGVCNDHNQPYYSSWQLKNIISPDKGDTIKFTYINVTENYYTGVAESINIKIGSVGPPEITSSCTANDYSCCLNEMEVDAKRLYKIETASTIISFITDTTVAINGGKKLTAIIIKNRVSGETIREFRFYYSYTEADQVVNVCNSSLEVDHRLWLDSICEENQGIKKMFKIFYKNRELLPARNSIKQDHWGFYNSNNGLYGLHSTLIPPMVINNISYPGANRDCDTAKVTFGLIKKLIYPTGGYSEFTFESNDFGTTQSGYPILTLPLIDQDTTALNNNPLDYDTIFTGFSIDHSQLVNFKMHTHKIENSNELETMVGVMQNDALIKLWGPLCPPGSSYPPMYYEDENLWLNAGNYTLFSVAKHNEYAKIKAYWQNYDTTANGNPDTLYIKYGGGVRIKRVTNYDGKQFSTRRFIYRKSLNNSKSSGILIGNIPRYNFVSYKARGFETEMGGFLMAYCRYISRTSRSITQQETTQGSYVGYNEVTELIGETGENGKIIHKFNYVRDIGGDYFPYPPKTSNNWQRGMEIEETSFDNNNIIQKRKKNLFQFTNKQSHNNFKSIGAVKIGYIMKVDPPSIEPWFVFAVEPYEIYCGWKYQRREITISFDKMGQNPIYDSIDYSFDTVHLQLSETKHVNSNGSIISKKYFYPFDYSKNGTINGDPFAYAITLMCKDSIHMINSIIESLDLIQQPGEQIPKVINGTITKYRKFLGYQILPDETLQLETAQPLSLNNEFTSSTINSSGTFLYDSKYKVKGGYKFNPFGNLQSYLKTDDAPVSFFYGYANTVQVIEAKNASYTVLNNAVNAATNNLENLLNNTIGDMTTVAQKGAWTQFNAALRSHAGMSNALVTTYTYKPLVGVTSITDPNGIPAYFEYDAMGRLVIGRDNNSDIVKKYDYHYGLPAK